MTTNSSMSGNSITRMAFVILGGLLISACSVNLSERRPGLSEEEAIKALLIAYQQAWNKHDESELSPLLDEGFVIWRWMDGKRKLVATKGSYVFWLRDLFVRYRYLTFGTPDIWLEDHGATVFVPLTLDARGFRGTFRVIQRGGKWLIQEFEF